MDNAYSTRHAKTLTRKAFTLVEILIVVVILGILAAIVVPQFSNASTQAKESALQQDLYRMRSQIELYRNEHSGDTPVLADFIDQMTLASNDVGDTAPRNTPGYPFGPYLPSMPENPFTDTIPISDGAVGTSAWYYDQATGDLYPNDTAEHRTW